jgi:hypothetical protein
LTKKEMSCSKNSFYINLIHVIQFKYFQNRYQAFPGIICDLSKQYTAIFNPLLLHLLIFIMCVLHYKCFHSIITGASRYTYANSTVLPTIRSIMHCVMEICSSWVLSREQNVLKRLEDWIHWRGSECVVRQLGSVAVGSVTGIWHS